MKNKYVIIHVVGKELNFRGVTDNLDKYFDKEIGGLNRGNFGLGKLYESETVRGTAYWYVWEIEDDDIYFWDKEERSR